MVKEQWFKTSLRLDDRRVHRPLAMRKPLDKQAVVAVDVADRAECCASGLLRLLRDVLRYESRVAPRPRKAVLRRQPSTDVA